VALLRAIIFLHQFQHPIGSYATNSKEEANPDSPKVRKKAGAERKREGAVRLGTVEDEWALKDFEGAKRQGWPLMGLGNIRPGKFIRRWTKELNRDKGKTLMGK